MDPKDFASSSSGKCLKTLKGYWAFIPNPLPPKLSLSKNLLQLLSQADRLLGELSGTVRFLSNPYLLIAPYTRIEAVSSSRIEGTQASLGDLFLYEALKPKKPGIPDVKEVDNYVKAMEYGIKRLRSLPISIRLICEIHKILMKGVRGGLTAPGELRRSQNWIGPPGCLLIDATIVPPPAEDMKAALGDWEKYHHSEPDEPALIQCALMHYQFGSIHPFLDGNGRIGRLLISFFLYEKKFLTQPLLYLSDFFSKHRDEYYSRLLAVSKKGDWTGWIEFFLRGVRSQASEAIAVAKNIVDLRENYREILLTQKKIPEAADRLIDEIFKNPVISIVGMSKKWKLSFMSVKRGVERLVEIGILKEASGRKRDRIFVAPKLMKILNANNK